MVPTDKPKRARYLSVGAIAVAGLAGIVVLAIAVPHAEQGVVLPIAPPGLEPARVAAGHDDHTEFRPLAPENTPNQPDVLPTRIEIPDQPGCSVKVKASWAETGAPAAGVGITVEHRGSGDLLAGVATATTDASGECELHCSVTGPLSISSKHGGYVTVECSSGMGAEVDLPIPLGMHVDGLVIDGTGAPVSDAAIWISGSAVVLSDPETVSGSDGRFEIEHVMPGLWLGATAPGFAPIEFVRFGDSATKKVQITLKLSDRGGEVKGLVQDSQGQPLPDALVMLGPARGWHRAGSGSSEDVRGSPPHWVWTAPDGTFADRALPLGLIKVAARARGFGTASENVVVEVGSKPPVVLTLPPAVTLYGKVRDEAGGGVKGVSVRFGLLGDIACVGAVTDEAGEFVVTGLTFGVIPCRLYSRDRALEQFEEVEIVRGEQDQYWSSVLYSTPTIRGQVFLADGSAAAGWSVRAIGRRGEQHSELSCVSDDNGAFVMTGCEIGLDYTVEIRRSPTELVPREVLRNAVPSGVPLRCIVDALSAIESLGCITGRAAESWRDRWLLASIELKKDRADDTYRSVIDTSTFPLFEVCNVLPGRYVVTMRLDEDVVWSGEVDVRAGATSDVGQR